MKISIITPNYNYGKFIRQTIESVVRQNYTNLEYIVIDDGSTDNSVEIIKQCKKNFPGKIKLIQQENKGQTAALNTALKAATGNIIGWINSDDTYCPNIMDEIAGIFLENNNIDIVFGNANVMDVDDIFMYVKRHIRFNLSESVFSGFANVFTSNAFFFKKNLIQKHGYFNDGFKCNMDGEFFSRIAFDSNVYYLNKPLANFRRQSHTKAAEKYEHWQKIVEAEIALELKNSYSRYIKGKKVSENLRSLLASFYRFRRILKRFIKGHYLLEYIEKRNYYRKYKLS